MKKFQMLLIVVASLRLLACGGGVTNPHEGMAVDSQGLEFLDTDGFLAFLNNQRTTTLEVLDLTCDIRSHAAGNIVAHRDGPDGFPGTADDDLFDSLEELEGIKWVGPWTMEQLYLCAYEEFGLLFAKEAGFMAFLNDPVTTFEVLDGDCQVRSDSAANIIDHRDGQTSGTPDPFDSVAELDSVLMVGLWTIDRLYACAGSRGYLDGSEPGDPNDPPPVPDDEWMTDHWDEVPADIQNLIQDQLYGRAHALRDQSVYFDVDWSTLRVFTNQGEPVYYEVGFLQWIDPEGGIQLYIVFTLDLFLNIVDETLYI